MSTMDGCWAAACMGPGNQPLKAAKQSIPICRLLGSFQASLEEITVLAFPDLERETAGGSCRPVEIHSYHDPTRGQSSNLAPLTEQDVQGTRAVKLIVHCEACQCDAGSSPGVLQCGGEQPCHNCCAMLYCS